jgi:hypothetical protein
MNVNCTWSNHWHHHDTRSTLIITPRIKDLQLKLNGGQHPILRDDRLRHFCSYNIVENVAHLVLECPLYDLITDKLPSSSH